MAQLLQLVAEYPAGVSGTELARRACRASVPNAKTRAFAGFLGMLAARGEIIRRGNLYFPRVSSAAAAPPLPPQAPPPGWYPTAYGPRYWDGSIWR
jgi:hypothetical protein